MAYTTGQTWGALRKAWKAYRIAKVQNSSTDMRKYAERIRSLQAELGVTRAKLGIKGNKCETKNVHLKSPIVALSNNEHNGRQRKGKVVSIEYDGQVLIEEIGSFPAVPCVAL